MGSRRDRPDTLRPPAPGRAEQVSIGRPRRPASKPPIEERADPLPSAPSSIPPPPDGWPSARDSSVPPPERSPSQGRASPPPPRRSPPPPRKPIDPRSEAGGGVYAERARGSFDARNVAMPAPPAPDRARRIEALVRELVRSGPENDEPVRLSLVAMGPEVLPALCRVFPGALWVDLSRPHRPLRSGRQISAVAACLSAFGDRAAPHLPALLRASRPEVRLAAALVAADIRDGSLVRPLAVRLWDEVPAVRNAAMIALTASAHLPEAMLLRQELVATLSDERTPEKWRKKAVWTLGQLRDAEAAPLLVEQLAAERDVAKVARQCLTLLVGRDLGRFRLRWRAFFRRHANESRVEWLIDALDQADATARLRATEELILATGEGFDRRHAAATRETARELAEFYRRSLQGASAAQAP